MGCPQELTVSVIALVHIVIDKRKNNLNNNRLIHTVALHCFPDFTGEWSLIRDITTNRL